MGWSYHAVADKNREMIWVRVPIDPKLHRFFRQRSRSDGLSLSHVVRMAIVAYVVGDLQVHYDGYRVPPARKSDATPSMTLEHKDGSTETWSLEDMAIVRELHEAVVPYGWRDEQRPRPRWHLRELHAHIKETTGRPMGMDSLRWFLRKRFPKPERRRGLWRTWSGPDDPEVKEILEAIEKYREERAAQPNPYRLGLRASDLAAARKVSDEHIAKKQHEARKRAEERSRGS